MPYTHFRMIGYEVPTVTLRPTNYNDRLSGWDPGTETPKVARIPVPDDLPDDARKRLRRLASVVNAAWLRHSLLLSDNPSTLKIFIVPEFYFRPDKAAIASNSYPDNVANRIFQTLNSMFSHADFKDWLFVCGTVIWDSANDTFAKTKLYFNTGVVVEGGKTNSIRLVEKKINSSIDGVPPTFFAPGADAKVKLIFDEWSAKRLRVFDLAGISFGLEVCLDHGLKVLKTTLAQWQANEGATKSIKLHLLSAGGKPLETDAVAAKKGGYILRNDGHVLWGPNTELKQVPTSGTTLVDTANEYVWNVDSSLQLPVPTGYVSITQRVVFYPALPIPT
ncbi:hypothetical protein [Paenibacillus sp. HJGM_3]|uniref:hypothetical protein n=1 Tax=Paenibacillus sp. HJGM_3 TaxID=3379816 RepID=UPI00385AF9CB